jgi:hypothetical protein
MVKPRNQHYVFAHVFLRQIVLDTPWQFFAMMASPDAAKILVSIWDNVGRWLEKSGKAVDASPSDGLLATPTRIAGFPAVVITLPTPIGLTEAYFVAVVMRTLELPKDMKEKGPVSYYALELGLSIATDSGRTVLTQWDNDAHLNYGDGPVAEFEAFRLAVEKKLENLKKSD